MSSDEGRRESLRGPVQSKKSVSGHHLWSSPLGGGHWLGGAPLTVVRLNECLWSRSLCSSVSSTRQASRAHAINSQLPQPALAPLHKVNRDRMPGLLPVSADVSMVPKNGVTASARHRQLSHECC